MKHSRIDFTGAIRSNEAPDKEQGPSEDKDNEVVANKEKGPSEDKDKEVNTEEEYPELPYYPSSDDEDLDVDDIEKGKANNITDDTELETSSTSDRGSHTEQQQSTQAECHVVTDINAYEGATLGEKIDNLITSHPVVMFNRTWCLFSVDAINFLVIQMNVPVHSVELDMHQQGKDILKYISGKYNYNTTPFIFIQGEFLGGFSEVNALYAQGKLQEDYLQGLSQADRCEAFLVNGEYQMSTYFWFPEKVDANVVRLTGVLTSFASALCTILVQWEEFFWARYIAYALALDFVLRLLGGAKFSVFGRISMLLALPLDPIPRMGKPKQFATCCGIIFSGLGSTFFLLPFLYSDIVGSAFMGGLAIASGMEGFLDFCVGCVFFRIGVKLGIFKGTR